MVGEVETLQNGVTIYQTTDEGIDKCNIYCEFPWCPPDSHCFVYMHYAPEHAPNVYEFIACDFSTWEKRLVGRGCGGQTMANGGKFYYRHFNDRGKQELVCCDLLASASRVIDLPDDVPRSASFALSQGERYLAFSKALSYDPQLFGVGIADLHAGICEIIHEDPWICNPHLQFEPSEGRELLVQHNRGCVFTPEGRMERLVGEEGCTLFLLNVPDGKVTRLHVGPPYTASLSGHETWLGNAAEILATLNYMEDYDYGKGRIVGIRAGGDPREICVPWELNHIGIEPSGRVFAGDAYRPDEIIIGSPRTNRAAVVCPSQASYHRARRRAGELKPVFDSHPHAYISPDRKWIVFNSDREGAQQIYAAAIPAEMMAALEEDGNG